MQQVAHSWGSLHSYEVGFGGVITYTFFSHASMMQHADWSLFVFRVTSTWGINMDLYSFIPLQSLVLDIFLARTEIQEFIEMILVMI